MEGCSAPLVVKFADTQKEKEQKKIQQLQASILSLGTTATATTNGTVPTPLTPNGGTTALGLANAPTALGQSATTIAANAPLMTNPPQPVNPFIGADAMSTSSLQLLQQMQAVGLQQQLLQGLITQLFSLFSLSIHMLQYFSIIFFLFFLLLHFFSLYFVELSVVTCRPVEVEYTLFASTVWLTHRPIPRNQFLLFFAICFFFCKMGITFFHSLWSIYRPHRIQIQGGSERERAMKEKKLNKGNGFGEQKNGIYCTQTATPFKHLCTYLNSFGGHGKPTDYLCVLS